MKIILFLFFALMSTLKASKLTDELICTKELESIVNCNENSAFIFMKRMHVALLDDGTTSVLIKKFSKRYGVAVRVSDAFGKVTSTAVPTKLAADVAPLITGPVKDVTAMRAYALGSAFNDDSENDLLVFSATIINSTAKMTLITILASKTNYHRCDLNIFENQ